MKHFTTHWKTHDGLEIFAQGWQPDVLPAKAVACFVHGIGDHSSRHEHVAEAFTNAGYVFFTGDMRGHGKSQGQRGHFPSMEAIMQDMDIFLHQARNLFPALPLILYGHSLGGILVLHYALARKPNIEGVISVSPGLHNALQKKPLMVMMAQLLGGLFPKASVSNRLPLDGISRDEKVVQDYKNDPLSMGLGKMMIHSTKWTLKNAGKFRYPLLIMHGKADFITYASGSMVFAAPIKENCKLILWEGAYHELHNEPEKAEILKAMIGWTNQLVIKS
jgi:alpha-beta hydrolase superfamily lysophospholipase